VAMQQNFPSRKGPFALDIVNLGDLQAGKLEASWRLGARHSSFTVQVANGGQLSEAATPKPREHQLRPHMTTTLLPTIRDRINLKSHANRLQIRCA
jgi:hypothetical protein